MEIAIGIVVSLLTVWVLLMVALLVGQRRTGSAHIRAAGALRLLPDTVVLVRRLSQDKTLSGKVRMRLYVLMGYLLMPIDLVPDFVPVLGYADDVILVALVLRSVVRRAGSQVIDRHWPGNDEGLAAIKRLCGLSSR